MRALDRKLWRDLWHLRGQALAIVLVIASGVATFVMFVSTLDSLKRTRSDFYRAYRFGDVFASLKRAPERLKAQIGEIPGVDRVDTRVVTPVTVDIPGFPELVNGLLTSVPDEGDPPLNRLYLRQGRSVEAGSGDEVVLSEAFAQAHDLRAGDPLTLVIKGRRKTLTVVGTGVTPEHIHQLRPGSLFPDFERYGVMWMARTPLGNASDLEGAFNSVVLSLIPGANLQDVIDRLDELLRPYGGEGAYGREDQSSHRFLSEEFNQLATLTTIFPAIFLGVASFLLNVVVTRLVGTQREQIASLKAFGYGTGAVTAHYLKLVAVVVSLGVATGVAGGAWLGQGLSLIYSRFFRLPYLAFGLRPAVVAGAAAGAFGAVLLGAAFAVRQAARLRPAEAMRPEPPARYRATFVEELGIRRFLSQPTRMILRHLGRQPAKSALSVVGISLACAITMTGRFQDDTVGFMVHVQYGLSQREDLSVTFVEPTSRRVEHALRGLPGVEHVEVFRSVPVRLRFEHRSYRTQIQAFESASVLKRVLDLELRPVELPPEGVVLSSYLGKILGVRPGDLVTAEILEGSRPVAVVPVAALVEQYLGVSAYMDIGALNRLMREGRAVSGAYLSLDERHSLELYGRIKEMPRVAGAVVRSQELRNFHAVMRETMLFFVSVAAAFAAVIAFGVVYNSARIALTERSRELATLRVLGFTRGEISYILLGELGVLTLAALPLGLLLGRALCGFIARSMETDLYRVPLILEPDTYAFAAAVVIGAATLSGLVVRRRLDRLDLVAVLKAKE